MILRFCLLFVIHVSLLVGGEIKAIVFDFGGVIGHDDHQMINHFLATSFGVSDESVEKILDKRNHYIAEGGKEADFFIEYADEKGIHLSDDWVQQYQLVSEKALSIDPEMIKLVQLLQKGGYVTAMLSNVTEAHAEIIRKMGVYDYFKPLLLSYKLGVEKPNPAAFEMLLEALHLPADEVVFVDNEERNITAAKKLKIDAILFVTTAALIDALKARHIVVETLSSSQ